MTGRLWHGRFFFCAFVGVLMIFGGCAKLSHLDQLLTLKAVSEEQQSLGTYVRLKDERFERLLTKVCSGDFPINRTKAEIAAEFGAPIYVEAREDSSETAERWIYRRQTRYFETPRVSLDFNREGHLIAYEPFGCPQGE